jgi:hypothetical protein
MILNDFKWYFKLNQDYVKYWILNAHQYLKMLSHYGQLFFHEDIIFSKTAFINFYSHSNSIRKAVLNNILRHISYLLMNSIV